MHRSDGNRGKGTRNGTTKGKKHEIKMNGYAFTLKGNKYVIFIISTSRYISTGIKD